MNSRLTLLVMAMLAISFSQLSAQAPQKLNYQAVLRDADGELLASQDVFLRFTIHELLPAGPVVFIEKHQPLTTARGMVNLRIGEGQRISGNLNNIEWSDGTYFLQLEMSNDDIEWSDLGTIQFLTVPYAFYADRSGKSVDMQINDLTDVQAPDVNNGQTLKWNGTNWVPGIDSDVQKLSLDNNILTISGGNSVDLPEAPVYTAGDGITIFNNVISNSGDRNPNDDITINTVANGEISGPFNNLFLRSGVVTSEKIAAEAVTFDKIANDAITSDKIVDGSIGLADLGKMGATDGQTLKWNNQTNQWEPAEDINSDAQELSLNGEVLSISNGNSIQLPMPKNYIAGQGIQIVNGTIINTGDLNPDDDLTTTSQSGGDLNGTFSNLKIKNDVIQSEHLINETVTTQKIKDRAITNEKLAPNSINSSKIENGTIAAEDLSDMGASNGEVLQFDGSDWRPVAQSNSWASSGTNISNNNNGNVGIGLSSPSAKLHLMTDGNMTNGFKISAPDRDSEGAAILLDANLIDWSIIATNNNFSTGANKLVFRSTTTSNNVMLLTSDGNLGIGTDQPLYKLHVATTDNEAKMTTGYFTNANLMNDVHVLHAEYTGLPGSRDISAVFGKSFVNPGYGTGGEFEGGNYGVYARAIGLNSGRQVVGVYGTASGNAGTRIGVYGYANASAGANFNYGVYGASTSNALGNYAGYFLGNVQVSGTLSKAAGTFKIDHPQDPENKYLMHSFVESPDMMNIYNGNAVTDEQGFATVQLPDYFEALNMDFRYQLTVIGTFAQAIVREKIKDNQFVIQTNEPNIEVSWQVTGVRNDPYARENRVVPVVEKPANEKGTYLNPELYDQPAEKQLGSAPVKD